MLNVLYRFLIVWVSILICLFPNRVYVFNQEKMAIFSKFSFFAKDISQNFMLRER